MRKLAKGMLVGIILAASVPAGATDGEPTDLPKIIAYGRFDDGSFATCMGVECGEILGSLGSRDSTLNDALVLEPQDRMSRREFCKALKNKRPPNCNASDPPSTPGLDPNWAPNGCGTGGLSNFLLDKLMEGTYGDYYSGNLDKPYRVSFKGACDAHDACWGVAGDRSTCDFGFNASLQTACGTLKNPRPQSICLGFAGTYYSAVSTSNIGNDNYDKAVAARRCALWARDVKANNCDG